MFSIKICGITSVNDALTVAAAGADAVGLNFYSKSPRYVEFEVARRICDALSWRAVKVGLFVNMPSRDVCRIFDQLRLDLIQLHGDEPPELLAELGGRPVIRAFRLDERGLQPVARYLEQCRQLQCLPAMALVDSCQNGQYGGTGKTVDWAVAKEYPATVASPPMVLAGGLTPDNVGRAIQAVRPKAVDTASGVELVPGRKSDDLVRQFVKTARQAFHSLLAGRP